MLGGDVDAGTAHAIAVLRCLDGAAPVPPVPDGDAWLDAAERHGVLATVAGLHAAAGHPLPERAERECWRARAHGMRTLADLGSVADTLDTAGVPWLVIKGPALAAAFYPEGVVRPSADLDVLVRAEDLEVAVVALVVAGARERDADWSAMWHTGHGEVSLDLVGGLCLDLHWHLISKGDWRDRLRLDTPGLLARSHDLTVRGLPARTLGLLDTIVHLGVHGCLSGGHRLRWLLDLDRAIRVGGVSPACLADHARATGSAVPVWLMLERAERYLSPELRPWRQALDGDVPARAALRAWSARFPPGAGDHGRLSGRAVYLHGGTGTARVVRAAGASAAHRVLRRARAHEEQSGDAVARSLFYDAVRTGHWPGR